jgi:hypothetical protein
MKLVNDVIEGVNKNNSRLYFPIALHDFKFCNNWVEQSTIQFIVDDYESFHKKKFSKCGVYPLLNTYIIPIHMYENIMPWVSQLYYKMFPWCNQHPNSSHFGHVAGIFERVMGFAIGEENMEYTSVYIHHDNNLKKFVY